MSVDVVAVLAGVPWRWVFTVGCVVAPLAYWVAAVPRRTGARAIRPSPPISRERDAVSLAVGALESGRFSPLLRSARNRLNTVAVETTGRTLADQPGLLRRLRRRPPAATRRIRQLARRLRRLEWSAGWLETAWLPRWDPWRTPAGTRQSLGRAVAHWLHDLDQLGVAGGTAK